MAKGLLREITRDAMSATLMQEGWLKQQFAAYMAQHPIGELITREIGSHLQRSSWDVGGLQRFINEKIDQAVSVQIQRLHTRYDGQIKEIVASELRKRFA